MVAVVGDVVALAVTPVGESGRVAGIAGADGAEALPVPALLVAVTVKVYGVPLVRPVTVQPVEAVVQVRPPGDEVTVYPLMAAPPSEAGAVQDTTDWVLALDVAPPRSARSGELAGMAAAEGADAGLVPLALVAVTVNV